MDTSTFLGDKRERAALAATPIHQFQEQREEGSKKKAIKRRGSCTLESGEC